MDSYLDACARYFEFSGRSRRREYWIFVLVNSVISFGLSIASNMVAASSNSPMNFWSVLAFLFSLVILIPSWSVFVRRMHDTGRSGWWLFISLVPLVGVLILLYFLLQDSQAGQNKYGPNPKMESAAAMQ